MVKTNQAGNTISLAADIVAPYAANNKLPQDRLSKLLMEVHDTIKGIENGDKHRRGNQNPAVSVAKSVTSDYLICLEDGEKLQMLKRYLRTHYGMSPEDYRRKWGLPVDYPMVAPGYSKQRSKLAKQIGLGKKPSAKKPRLQKRRSEKNHQNKSPRLTL
ncbi:MAG: MucR family transcriptional regulator [Pseudomonadota bacterium]